MPDQKGDGFLIDDEHECGSKNRLHDFRLESFEETPKSPLLQHHGFQDAGSRRRRLMGRSSGLLETHPRLHNLK